MASGAARTAEVSRIVEGDSEPVDASSARQHDHAHGHVDVCSLNVGPIVAQRAETSSESWMMKTGQLRHISSPILIYRKAFSNSWSKELQMTVSSCYTAAACSWSSSCTASAPQPDIPEPIWHLQSDSRTLQALLACGDAAWLATCGRIHRAAIVAERQLAVLWQRITGVQHLLPSNRLRHTKKGSA